MARNQLVERVRGRLDSGVIYEPRGYFDMLEMPQILGGSEGGMSVNSANAISTLVESAPEVFRNGENYPVTLTHAAFAVDYLDNADQQAVDDERDIQRIGVRMRYHDEYYMNRRAFPAPMWANKPAGLADTCSFGTSIWHFADGKHVAQNGGGSFVLSARDTLRVDVELLVTSAYDITITVSFTGIGLLSERPYFLSSSTTRTAAGTTTLIPNDFRNDGAEPILITDMNVNITGEGATEALSNEGDIRRTRINVRQVGNGTSGYWLHGPRTPDTSVDRCPATLLGITGGRAVIHEFPEPLVWEPGDGITLEANGLIGSGGQYNPNTSNTALPDSTLTVGLFGYIVVR
jgi:hypothetical protein